MRLDKVIVANGNIYTPENPSVTNSDVHSGETRENVGQAQVSTGLNLTNFAETSGLRRRCAERGQQDLKAEKCSLKRR